MSNPRGYGEMTCNQTRDTLIRFKNQSNDGNNISNSGTIHFKYCVCEKVFSGGLFQNSNFSSPKKSSNVDSLRRFQFLRQLVYEFIVVC